MLTIEKQTQTVNTIEIDWQELKNFWDVQIKGKNKLETSFINQIKVAFEDDFVQKNAHVKKHIKL